MKQAFEPSKGSHALIETVFFVQFSPEIEVEAFTRIDAGSADIVAQLPRKTEMKRFQLLLTPDGGQAATDMLGGLEFARIAPNGEVSWLLRLSPDSLSVHCLDYTRWDEVWTEARNLLLMALGKVPSGVGIAGVGLKNVDRFSYAGDMTAYRIEELFRHPSRYIAGVVYEAGQRWHCHTGWFASLDDVGDEILKQHEVLNQLNLSSGQEVNPTGANTFVNIDHNMLVRSNQVGELGISSGRHDWLDNLMSRLHFDNKKVLADILTDEVGRRINLAAEERK